MISPELKPVIVQMQEQRSMKKSSDNRPSAQAGRISLLPFHSAVYGKGLYTAVKIALTNLASHVHSQPPPATRPVKDGIKL